MCGFALLLFGILSLFVLTQEGAVGSFFISFGVSLIADTCCNTWNAAGSFDVPSFCGCFQHDLWAYLKQCAIFLGQATERPWGFGIRPFVRVRMARCEDPEATNTKGASPHNLGAITFNNPFFG